VVQGWSCILKGFHSPREEEEGKDPCGEKPQRIYKYNSHHSHPVMIVHSPDHIPHEEEEGVSGRGAKVFAIDRRLEELDEFLQTPETALQTQTFQLVVQILQQNPDDLDDGEDKGAKFFTQHRYKPERSPKRRKHWESRNVIWLFGSPVVFVVRGLSTVESKKALRVRTLGFYGTRRVVLNKDTVNLVTPQMYFSNPKH
uniref:Uncharacterized protein n=1 Tax=Neolamprologus brichardi TaxID=32507 RepID=A0A3Q4GSN2_NEOBR